jgi:hypothetical protein
VLDRHRGAVDRTMAEIAAVIVTRTGALQSSTAGAVR